MDAFKARAKHGPEYHIQELFIPYLEGRGWMVERLIGNAFQKGIPDLYLANPDWGTRWVDIKVHGRYDFTRAQIDKWPVWEQAGIGIWILGATSKKACTKSHMAQEHKLLFEPPNMRDFWKDKYDYKPDVDKMVDDLVEEHHASRKNNSKR